MLRELVRGDDAQAEVRFWQGVSSELPGTVEIADRGNCLNHFRPRFAAVFNHIPD